MTRLRLTFAVSAIAASALLLTACPRANGYQAVRVFPQISLGEMTGTFPMPGSPNVLLVLTRGGVVYRADIGAGTPPTVFLDIHDQLNANSPGDEEGLLGLAYAPDYVSSRKFYVYYTAGGPRHNRISRFFAGNVAADARFQQIVIDLPPKQFSNHNGGNIVFGPDGSLYIGTGDGGSAGDPFGNGQNTGSLLGKVLRIDVSSDRYGIPADNPFARGGGAPEVYAYGLRNPWRFSFDQTGELWLADVGQGQREEVDRIVNGGNYGWNIVEGDLCFKPSSGCNRGGLIPPRAVYGHDSGCSITGGYVYRGAQMPEMAGWYVYGDFCSGRIWAVSTVGDGSAVQLADTSLQISSFMQGADGELYVVSFDGGIYLLTHK